MVLGRSGWCRASIAQCKSVWFALLLSNYFLIVWKIIKTKQLKPQLFLSPTPTPKTFTFPAPLHLCHIPARLRLGYCSTVDIRSDGQVDDPLVLVAAHEVVNEVPVKERLQYSGHEGNGHQLLPLVDPNSKHEYQCRM